MSTKPPDAGLSLGPAADQLTIETPEQTSLDFAVAGIGSRFLAVMIDFLIQGAVGLVVGIGAAAAIAVIATVAPKASMWATAVLMVFYFFLYFGYFALFEIIWNGQTPGKRRVGIRVIKDSGRPLTPAESIGRNLMRIVDWLPTLYAVGLATAFLSKGNKRLGDLVVGSLVVRETSLSELRPLSEMADAPAQQFAPSMGSLGAHNLSVEESALVDSFLSRRGALDPLVRYRMADEVLRRLRPKLTLPTDAALSPERTLEAIAYERRSTGQYSR